MNTPLAVLLLIASAATLPTSTGCAAAEDGFGVKEDGEAYVVNTGADLIFRVRRESGGSSLRGAGDISSLQYHGIDYQDETKGSHINSGFGGLYDNQDDVTVQAAQDGDFIRITVHAGNLIHYYMAHRGDPKIYMATWFSQEPKPGLVRFIVRVPWERLPHGPEAADLHGTDNHPIEAHDIFGRPDGQTRSKHYSNMRLKDWRYFGATGSHVGLWMVRDNNEGNSGGPFYRSLLDQGASDQELTYIINYGEGQTEPFRTGILNSYTLVFTDGNAPGLVETSWFSRMNLKGYVPSSGRGSVAGRISQGLVPEFHYTVGFSGPSGQYWTDVRPENGTFQCENMLPGLYRVTLYKNELEVAWSTAAVSARQEVSLNGLSPDDPEADPALWRIGHWDGSPQEFLNGDKITTMHPSDIRMAPWTTSPFVIGRSSTHRDFPAYQWIDVNNDRHIRFSLPEAPSSDLILRVGITDSAFHGRPSPSINGWEAKATDASKQPTSRTLTVGTYRGNNVTYRFIIPADVLHKGENDLTLRVISGSQGIGFLSPGISYDAVDLIPGK
ncbi:hypothetical protein KBX73_12700 [Acetobacter persici]|nr:rhamnogalacturonan lyase B N-terminal domain-containing protein [Acetobacter persici]MCP9320618.1 hypothetical protein [Acetobacter persici]